MESNSKINNNPTTAPIQHKTIAFPEEGIIFDSDFDSGNLLSVEKKSDATFELFIASDCQDLNLQVETYRVWFYFRISNTLKTFPLKLSIKNLSPFLKETFSKGHVPVYHIDGTNEGAAYDQKWTRLTKTENNFCFVEESNGIHLNFTFEIKTSEIIYFAFSYPWSYNDNLNYIKTLRLLYKNHPTIYFNAETIVNSLEKRKVHLLTITSLKNQSLVKEKTIQKHLFKKQNQRPFIFLNKRYIVISARVHPGESPASYVLQGCLDYILNNLTFLDNFVLVVVPMLNPDGVFRGYYRLDTNGKNLNRVYHSSYYVKYPAIFALKRVINYLKEENRLLSYFDLHAHNIIDKSFLFGNKAESLDDHLEIILIPKIMSMISAKFELKNCKFESKGVSIEPKNSNGKEERGQEERGNEEIKTEDKDNNEKTNEIIEDTCKDKKEDKVLPLNEEKKEVYPVAKTHFFKHEGLKLSYTFECSYNGGFLTNRCEDLKNSEDFFHFDRNGFKECGRHLIMSILESNGKNDKSILEPFGYKSIYELKQSLQKNGGL